MSDRSQHHEREIIHLNVDDLEIEELEQRLELASVSPDLGVEEAWDCGTFDCGTFDLPDDEIRNP
ncbi:MAG TPA: hypothetical protein VF212_13635 [Longimicrobiales bacterium]